MRLALFASLLTGIVMWFALGNTPARSQQPETKPAPTTCQSCGQAKGCPYCGHPHGWKGMHKWEYKCVHQSEKPSKKAAEAMSEQFTALGDEGWRLKKADDGFWCFARIRSAQ
ncbi:MAG: hypothetical protein PVH21_04350 [Myxococcales bacterium]|jgi:hypothetical protein